MGGAVCRKLGKDALDLRFFLSSKLTKLVICLNGCHGLNKKRSSGGRYIVNEARDSAFALGLYRNDKAIRAHGYDRLLKHLRV